jgi:DNA invertase Pin-like site-specific DNA recombinase
MEKESGGKSDRPELNATLGYLCEGDTLVVTKLDRLVRSTFDLYRIAKQLEERGIHLVILKQNIDTSTPVGKLMFTMLGAVAEFEKDLINEKDGRRQSKGESQRHAYGEKRAGREAGQKGVGIVHF